MAKLREMQADKGDALLKEYDLANLAETAEARRLFNLSVFGSATPDQAARPRKLAFANYGSGRQQLIKQFDETAPDIVIMPMVVGG